MELLVGELARRAAVNIQTVKYYERRSLILPEKRKGSGYRVYSEESLKKLRFIRQTQQLGFSLKEVGELLRTRSSSSSSKCSKVLEKTRQKLREVKEKIGHLSKMDTVLQQLISDCTCRKPSGSCPILACFDQTMEAGPAKRKLKKLQP